MSAAAVGFAHGEAVDVVEGADPAGSSDVLDVVVGTVVSLVERRRDEAELIGTGDEPEL